MIISHSFLLRMRNVPDVAQEKTHFIFINFFPKVVPVMRVCGESGDGYECGESGAGYECVWRKWCRL
jgi:hypothetical protein